MRRRLAAIFMSATALALGGMQPHAPNAPWLSLQPVAALNFDNLALLFSLPTIVVYLLTLATIKQDIRHPRWSQYAILTLLVAAWETMYLADNLFLFLAAIVLAHSCWGISPGLWARDDRHEVAVGFLAFRSIGIAILTVALLGLLATTTWLGDNLPAANGSVPLPTSLSSQIDMLRHMSIQNVDRVSWSYWQGVRPWIFAALFLATLMVLPIVPFHRGVLRATVEAPPAIRVFVWGAGPLFGLTLLARFVLPLFAEQLALIDPVLGPVLILGALFCAMCAVGQNDLCWKIGYIQIAQLHLVVRTWLTSNALGPAAVSIFVVGSSLSFGLTAFLLGDFDPRRPRLRRDTAVSLAAALAAVAGIPLTSGGVLYWLTAIGIYEGQGTIPQFFEMGGTLAAMFLIAWAVYNSLHRTADEQLSLEDQNDNEPAARSDWLPGVLSRASLIALLVIGIAPQRLIEYGTAALDEAIGRSSAARDRLEARRVRENDRVRLESATSLPSVRPPHNN